MHCATTLAAGMSAAAAVAILYQLSSGGGLFDHGSAKCRTPVLWSGVRGMMRLMCPPVSTSLVWCWPRGNMLGSELWLGLVVYVAPDVRFPVLCSPRSGHDYAAYMWSLGSSLSVALTGEPPSALSPRTPIPCDLLYAIEYAIPEWGPAAHGLAHHLVECMTE